MAHDDTESNSEKLIQVEQIKSFLSLMLLKMFLSYCILALLFCWSRCLCCLQAFKKMNKDMKKEHIEILKSKYGIDLTKD